MPSSVNFEYFRGDDRVLQFRMQDVGSIAGFTTEWTVKKNVRRSTLLTLPGSILSAGSASTQGLIGVDVAKSDILDLGAGVYHHVLKRTDTGAETTLAEGTITVRLDGANL